MAGAGATHESRVVVDSSGCLPSQARGQSTPIPTGQVLACFKQAFTIADTDVVFLAGKCCLQDTAYSGSAEERSVYVAAKLSPATQPGERIANLRELAGSWSYRPASLALAMVAAHGSGHTDIATIGPMLDGTGVFSIGALTARSLAPSSLQLSTKTQSRSKVLQYCRALEFQVSESLIADADAMQPADADMAGYIEEWAAQTTVTDLKDIPDDLLDRMPVFNDVKLLTEAFSFTARLDRTEAFSPPKQSSSSFVPSCTGDLFNPLESVEERKAIAESKLVAFYKEMWAQADGLAGPASAQKADLRFPVLVDNILRRQRLGKLRPEPLVMGLECWTPGVRHSLGPHR